MVRRERLGKQRGMPGVARGGSGSRALRGWAAGLLALAMLLSAWSGAMAAEAGGDAAETTVSAAPTRQQIQEAVGALQASLAKAEPMSDWVALALARGGKPAPNRYAAQLARIAPESYRLATDYARVALAVSAHGWDARQAGPAKTDLLAEIAHLEHLTRQGPNGAAYALMALDAGDYTGEAGDLWTRDSLIKWLLANRGEGGGWSLAAGKSEVDLTGIVLTALAPHRERADVKAAIDGALDWLSSVQNEHGGFGSVGIRESSESAAQVIIALTALDIDPALDARFVKNGKSVLARFMEYRQADGGFAHLPDGRSDGLASLFALLGLTAVDRWQDGLPGLYSGARAGSDVQVFIYGPEGRLAQGAATGRTALEDAVQVLREKQVAYTIERHPQFGPYLTAIGEYGNGHFGGYDGWQYAVKKNGRWVHDLTGMSIYDPKGAEQLVVYYGEAPALIHGVKLDPAVPREGQPVVVTVEQETYDWDKGEAVVAPAAGAKVTVGHVSAVADKDGRAELPELPAGKTTLRVDGYKQGGLPAYITFEQPLQVQSYVKRVEVRVEGDQGLVVEGPAQGGTALEALEALLKARNVPYEIGEFAFGRYVSSIKGIEAGRYGGTDGWMFAVTGREGATWTYPAESIGTFLLEEGDQVVVYYGDNTALPEPLTITPAATGPDAAVGVTVKYRAMDWETGRLGPARPLAGVRVSAAGVTAETDGSGVAGLSGLPEGVHDVIVTGYGEDRAPSVLRTVGQVIIAEPYSDQSAIAGWAADWVREARASGVLLGKDDQRDAAFEPKRGVTRAEFVAAMVRAIGVEPAAAGKAPAFADVAAEAWYAGEIEAAAQAGLIAGVEPGKFAPDAPLTREQAAQLLARALKIQSVTAVIPFADEARVAPGAKASVQAAIERGWMTLQADGTFLPKSTVTREQAAVIAVRLFREFR